MGNSWSVHDVAEGLMKIFPNLGRNVSAHLRESGEEETTLMQVGLLHQISERPVTASELAKRRKVSLQSVSVVVQGLVERGWIIRIPDPGDRRQFLLEITAEGIAKAEATRNQIIDYLASIMEDFTHEEISAAQIFLPALSRILTQHITPDNTQERQRTLQEEQTSL